MSSKKTKSSSTDTKNTTIKNEVPDWIQNPQMQVAGNIQGILNQGANAFAPQTSGLQQQAFDAAGGLNTSGNAFQGALDALGGVGDITAASLLDGGLDRYYNPFKDQVLNPVLTDYDVGAGKTRAAQAADAARNKAFQGSRFGIQEAQTEGELARGRSAAEGGLLKDMYTQATGLAQYDASNRQQASLANQQTALARAQQQAALAQAEQENQRANLGIQAGLGGVLTDQQNAASQYPLQFQQQINSLLAGLNPDLYSTQQQNSTGTSTSTTKENPGLLGGLGQAAQIASLFMKAPVPSDGRVKVGVKPLFRDWKGRRWVEFAYRWAPKVRHVGVIAQEVFRTDPEAVSYNRALGCLTVDYGRL